MPINGHNDIKKIYIKQSQYDYLATRQPIKWPCRLALHDKIQVTYQNEFKQNTAKTQNQKLLKTFTTDHYSVLASSLQCTQYNLQY